MNANAQWLNSRGVVQRIVITGTLTLDTPAHFGNGDAEGLTDMPLLYDPLDGSPLLTGASIAGALRNYLREYDGGYGAVERPQARNKSRAEQLFGHLDDSDTDAKASVQSWLMIDDARGQRPAQGKAVELRDGVAIDAKTRTVETHAQGRGQKYDIELLAAGTTFDLMFELWLTADELRSGQLLNGLVTALRGLEHHAIGLGMRKRRGFGECHAENWRTCIYDMTKPAGLIAWLANDRTGAATGLPDLPAGPDQRKVLHMKASFEVAGSLLIRSGTGAGDSPDMVHLGSFRDGQETPILSGTSVAGAVRGRALRIANTVLGPTKGPKLVDATFGRRIRPGAADTPSGSLVTVRETELAGGERNLVQNRVQIDRFTGGSSPAKLFSEQPIWGREPGQTGQALAQLDVSLRQQGNHEADFEAAAGLLLLVLKDLWTGDLPLGGESSVGRGWLRGQRATLTIGERQWTLTADSPGSLTITGDKDTLEAWVKAFHQWQESSRSAKEKQP
jgi:CRISPR/Cas system CSM-associated protein Csm3 (group 7 of RAMP superfamily)